MRTHLLAFIFCSFIVSLQGQVIEADSIVLVELYNATDGPNWTKQENWLSGPVGDWQGVKIGEGRVTEINLNIAGLEGAIPASIFSLDGLVSFAIRESNTELHLDDRMSDWLSLEAISVSGNQFSVELDVLCDIPNLNAVTFFSMNVGGAIPECFALLPLTRLNISGANLDSAEIPEFLGDIPTLINVNLANNNFTGEIPQNFCNGLFKFINLAQNALTGSIPGCLNSSGGLVQFFADNNKLTGHVPIGLFGPALTILDLGNNQLTGKLIDWPVLPGMDRLELNDNLFDGTFDGSILQSDNFRVLDLSHNDIDSIASFPELPLMVSLRVNDNALDFSDLEVFVPGSANFTYQSQADIGEALTVQMAEGDPLMLTLPAGGTITTYQWLKDGKVLAGESDATLSIPSLTADGGGIYHAEAYHDSFPALILQLAPVEVQLGTSKTRDLYTSTWQVVTNPVVDGRLVLSNLIEEVSVSGPAAISISDLAGRKMLRKDLHLLPPEINIDIAHLLTGVYILRLETKDGFGVWKIVK